jgi:bifunctional non-homologous end joining protein LigD
MATLEKYKKKRNFKETPEPRTAKAPKEGELRFVIQRHLASRLHYDFRLEMDGVLKSWAVPKGPSLNPKDKRLAMMVEDHPFEYRTFEGEIPDGNYGAGIVEIWDEGTYHSLETEDRKKSEKILLKELEEGSIKVVLKGKKVKGEFALVKLKGKEENSWLLIKHKDKYATDEDYDSENEISPKSRIPKHTSSFKAFKQKRIKTTSSDAQESSKVELPLTGEKKKPMPHDIKPMLATLATTPFDDKDWIFEIKWDGYRAIAEVDNQKVKLYSRNLLSFNDDYPTVVEALKQLGHNAILDGEIVALDKEGRPKFQLMQNMKGRSSENILYYVYDLIYLNGHDLTSMPLIERKKVLQSILPDLPNIKFSDHVVESGKAFFEQAQKNKLEGIIAKEAQSPYRIGKRSTEWLKVKTSMRQEAVIAGFTAPRGSRKKFGALVLGLYDKGEFKYIGHSGGGFNSESLDEVHKKLEPLIQKKSPFKEKVITNMPVTWVKPQLVCEIQFGEWTEEGIMRHPIFQGMREDKDAKDVVRETQTGTKEAVTEAEEGLKKSKKATIKKSSHPAKDKSPSPSLKTKRQSKNSEDVIELKEEIELDGKTLKLSNLDKLYWPEEKYSKGDLIKYYLRMSKYILPYLKDRPENMNRHPNGINGQAFYHKDMKDSYPDWLQTQPIYSESNDKDVNYLVCQNQATLTYMNNLGCIEINPWNSRLQSLENPDYVIIDLDPGENTFEEVIETAQVVKAILDKGKIEAYCKTSGATGMHIFIPMGAKYDYDQAKEFAHIIALMANEQLPKLTSLERSPKNRREQIYLDYLQNRKGQTLACTYSVRPKPGATVSTPLKWEEVKPGLHPSQFTIKNIYDRVEKEGDLFRGIFGKGIDIAKSLKNLGA